jgi:hypothetical protein
VQGKWDDKRNDYAYDITYRINAYRLGDAFSDYFRPIVYYGAHKQYNYWFTGQNTAIIDFEQTLDNLYGHTLTGANVVSPLTTNLNNVIRNDQIKRTFQPKSNESDNGADGNTNEPAANLAGYLYDPNSWSKVTLTIVGDPAWLLQGDNGFGQLATTTFAESGLTFSYQAFLPDGTINMDAGQALFELSFNTPSDYDFETGIIKPTGNETPDGQRLVGNDTKNASETYLYVGETLKSMFKQGKFTQTLSGSGVNQLPTKAAAEAYINAMTIAVAAREAQKANGVDPATGQNVTMLNGINPETGAPTIVTAGAAPAPPATPAVAAQPRPPTSSGQIVGTVATPSRLSVGKIVTNRLNDAIISANSAPPVNTPEQTVAPSDDSGSSSNTGADNGRNL